MQMILKKLQSNRVIEEILRVNKKYELWLLHGSPETQRTCEMCTEKRIATVSCLDCGKDMCKTMSFSPFTNTRDANSRYSGNHP